MVAAIETVRGKAQMMYVAPSEAEKPWHKLGQRFLTPPTIAQAADASGLNWTVSTEPLFMADGRKVEANATIRSSDKSILGVVGPSYQPLQNAEMFEFFRPLLDAEMVTLNTAGSLWEGRTVWCLAKINQPDIEVTDGDMIERYLLLSNAHDGSRAARVGFTPIRVVCWNTMSMAHRSGESQLVRLLHTKGILASLNALRDVMNVANQQFEATAEQYRKLARKAVNRDDLRNYVKLVLEVKPDDKISGQLQAKMNAMVACACEGRGTHGKTLWDAYNGVTEYLCHQASRTVDRRVESVWFGDAGNLSSRALKIAVELAS